MKYLLDTHAVIWYLEDSSQLPPNTKEIIDKNENRICLSSVSLWEIAIKISLGKLKLIMPLHEIFDNIEKGDFEVLQIENDYLRILSVLPFIHKDPFDRLLIATALAENLTIITADESIYKYDISWIWQG
jgi:PIN domain nuclease of toxin-antitoxin system